MSDWALQDTAGILIVAGAFFAMSLFTTGILQTVAVLLGVLVLLLWVFNSFMQGVSDATKES